MRNKTVVEVAYDKEFEELLEQLGLLEALVSSQLVCAFCGEVVTCETIFSVFSDKTKVLLCCSKPSCGSSLAREQSHAG